MRAALTLIAATAIAGCSEPETVAERMSAAHDAAEWGDTEVALHGYDSLCADPAADGATRIRAGVGAVVALIGLDRLAEAIPRFEAMLRAPGEGPDYESTARVLNTLARWRVDPQVLVGLVQLAVERHRGHGECLGDFAGCVLSGPAGDEPWCSLNTLPHVHR